MGRRLLFVSAGEPSGDNAAAHLISSLRQLAPDIDLFGLGGTRLKKLGQEQLVEGSRLAILGFWEVARRFVFFRKLLNHCAEEIRRRQPACLLLVDYPGFNLRLAARVRSLGIPIIYYISPQVWAWKRGRLHQISRLVDRMMLILPFEEELYRDYGVPAELVGHYLLDDIPPEYIASPLPEANRLALLPGSRPQEIERMLAPMLATARLLNERHGTTATIAAVKGACDYEAALTAADVGQVDIVYDDSRRVIFDSRLVLTASGTATLEVGLIGRPLVVVYKTGLVTYCIARLLVKLEMIALANLVLGEKVIPEFIQRRATPQRMAAELERYLIDESYRQAVMAKLSQLPDRLGGAGASRRAAERVSEYL
jgi:lipid-A-disaccharide synthase